LGKLATAFYHRLTGPLSAAGMILGALFWWAALTPSLVPRDGLLQGAIGGLCFIAYAVRQNVKRRYRIDTAGRTINP
jgi:uncharacterized membrane protein